MPTAFVFSFLYYYAFIFATAMFLFGALRTVLTIVHGSTSSPCLVIIDNMIMMEENNIFCSITMTLHNLF